MEHWLCKCMVACLGFCTLAMVVHLIFSACELKYKKLEAKLKKENNIRSSTYSYLASLRCSSFPSSSTAFIRGSSGYKAAMCRSISWYITWLWSSMTCASWSFTARWNPMPLVTSGPIVAYSLTFPASDDYPYLRKSLCLWLFLWLPLPFFLRSAWHSHISRCLQGWEMRL